MKKLFIALTALVLCGLFTETNAWFFGRRNYGSGGYRSRCYQPRCERPCERPCAPACEPCPSYEVVEHCEEAPSCAPVCCRYVRVEEPARLHKYVSYKWSCPPTCNTDGQEDDTEEITVVDKHEGTTKRVGVSTGA